MPEPFDYKTGFEALAGMLLDSRAARMLMCSEADRAVRVLMDAGRHDDAIALLQEHVLSDDSYDAHVANGADVED